MMTMEDIRKRLHELAEEHDIPELHELAKATKKRSPVRRAKTESRPLTPQLKAEIRAFAKAHPDLSYRLIADRFGVNPGRLSDTLVGKREDA